MTTQPNFSQSRRIKPGDKVVWNRATKQLEATVLKITAKRIQIEIRGDNDRSVIRYVKPESLDIINPTTKEIPRSQPYIETAEKELKNDFSSKSTIFWQSLSGLLSLVFGGVIIMLFSIWGNKLEIFYPDNSEHTFFVGAMLSSFGLVGLVVYSIKKQFEDASTPIEAFRATIRYTFWGWVYVTILHTILMLMPLLFGDWFGFSILIADTGFLIVTFMSIGAIIGGIQYFRLKVEQFDAANHHILISNEADISACKLGVLPYRARVRAFWHAVLFGLFSFVFIVMGFVIAGENNVGKDTNAVGFLLALGVGGLGAYKAFQFVSFLKDASLGFIEGEVSEKSSYSSRGITNYHLTCDGEKFTTNSKTWEEIIEGCKYRLWYSPVNYQVVASELQSYSPKQNQKQKEFAIAHMRKNRYKYIKESFRRGLDGPIPREKLEWGSLLPDKFREGGDLFYSFNIPLGDGSFYIGHSVCKLNQQLLENETKVENLINQVTQKLVIKGDEKQLHAVSSITDDWPFLVAVGGKIIPSLLEIAQENDNITSQALISQLLGDIARDTTQRLGKQTSVLLCQYCFVRYTAHEIYLSWLNTYVTYYGCRNCGRSREYFNHPGEIIAVLNDEMETYELQESVLKVNWLLHRTMFDFDKVEIVQARDEDVERFVVQVGNDTDMVRSPHYQYMQCIVSSNCGLSDNTKRILQRMFKHLNK